jgi:hypothetical protein
MKKLRAIQQRVGSESIPNDLRGVGQTPILSELPPCPYLVVAGSDLPTLEKVEQLFTLQLYPQDQVLVLESAVDESYKHKALRLWYAARFLLEQHPELSLQLGERDLLRETLVANIGQTNFIHPDRLRREPVTLNLPSQGQLVVTVLVQHLLVQVGYPLEVQNEEIVVQVSDDILKFQIPFTSPQALAV